MKRWIDILLDLFLAVVGLALLWIFAQIFLFASFHIPSDSMEPELVEGDFVVVWKPMLGARLFNLNKSKSTGFPDSAILKGMMCWFSTFRIRTIGTGSRCTF